MNEEPHAESTPLKREYWCFVSYKHADNKEEGRQWATWLHQQLETYEVPEDLVGKPNSAGEEIPERIFPVFRDEEELGAGSHLTDRLYRALECSRVLVVLCSPRVVESPYVDAEIRYFKKLGKADLVYAAVIDGEPGSRTIETGKCFPDPLQFEVDDQGELQIDHPIEPLASDFRLPNGSQGWTSPAAYRQALNSADNNLSRKEINDRVAAYTDRLELAKLKLISGILKVPLGVLQKRDKAYQLKREKRRARIFRRVAAAMFALLVAAVLGGFGFFLQKQAAEIARAGEEEARKEAEKNEEQALREGGKYWLQRAKLADYPAKQVYAAKAIAFRAFGPDDPKKIGYGPKDPNHPFWDTIPPKRLDPVKDQREYREARDILERPKGFAHPPGLLWSSPVSRHHDGAVNSVAYSRDGKWIASGGEDGVVRVWDAQSGDLVETLEGHAGAVQGVVFSGNGEWLVSAGAGGRVLRWDWGARVAGGGANFVRKFELIASAKLKFLSVAVSLNSSCIAASSGSLILLVDLQTGHQKAVLKGHSDSVFSMAFSPDGATLASGSDDNSIKLWDVATGEEKATFTGHSSDVFSVAFSPDGATVASGSWDGTIKLWDVATGGEKATLTGHSFSVRSVAFSPDGATVASGSGDRTIKLWDVATGEGKATFTGHSSDVMSVAFSPDGATVASGSGDRTINLWDVATGEEKATLTGHSGFVRSVAFSPDGATLASGSEDDTIKLWDVATGEEKANLTGHSRDVGSVAFSPDGATLASGSDDNSIKLWDVATGEEKGTLIGHSSWVSSVAFSPDGATLASGSWDKTIKLWDMATGEEKATFTGHSFFVRSVAFSPDGATLASGSRDRTIKLWDVGSGEEKAIFTGHFSDVMSVAFSPDGATLASGSEDNTIKLWDVATGEEKATLTGHSASVLSVAFSPDGARVASGSGDDTIKLWDVATGEGKATFTGHSSAVFSVAFSPDGARVASGSVDNTIKLWDVATGEEKATFTGHSDDVRSVAFSPDGATLASGSNDNTIKLWDVATGEEKATLTGHSSWVESVALSPDGATLVSGSDDGTIKLWDVATGEEKATFTGHSFIVWSVAFSPDGATVASGSEDTIKLWDLATGGEQVTFTGHSSFVYSVAFSPDGATLASGSRDKTIKLWDLATGEEKATLTGHSSAVESVAFSPDGATLVSGGDGTIKLWDVATGGEKASLTGHSDSVWSVAFSPDGATLASGSRDDTIKLWDPATGEEKATLSGHSSYVLSVAFSPDGATLASGSWDGTIKLWDLASASVTDWLDVSVYQRHHWTRLDSADELQWAKTSVNLGLRVPRANPAPDSLLGRLLQGQPKSEHEQARIRADFHLDHYQWKPFWLNWQEMDAADRDVMADQVVPAFALLAADPPPGYLPGWFEGKFLELRKEYPGIDRLVEPMRAAAFARGLSSRPGNSEMVAVARELFDSLPGYLKQKTGFEIVEHIYSSGSKDLELLAFADKLFAALSSEWQLELAGPLNSRAWNYATSAEASERNAAEAVRLATLVCEITESKNRLYVATLAAAHAEAGDFDKAVEWQTKAVELVEEEEKADYRSRLKLYKSGNPYHRQR